MQIVKSKLYFSFSIMMFAFCVLFFKQYNHCWYFFTLLVLRHNKLLTEKHNIHPFITMMDKGPSWLVSPSAGLLPGRACICLATNHSIIWTNPQYVIQTQIPSGSFGCSRRSGRRTAINLDNTEVESVLQEGQGCRECYSAGYNTELWLQSCHSDDLCRSSVVARGSQKMIFRLSVSSSLPEHTPQNNIHLDKLLSLIFSPFSQILLNEEKNLNELKNDRGRGGVTKFRG